jgi:CRISPR/Cas system-associated protein endoribonuclease Cas2
MEELNMRLFTLAEKRTGESSCLNGKIFRVRKSNTTGELLFIDALTGNVLWNTTKVLDQQDDGKSITFKTANSTYVVLNVSELLPTKEDVNLSEPSLVETDVVNELLHDDKPDISDLVVLDDIHTSKPINYGDGYDMHQFSFNREITKEEFIEFLKKENYKIAERANWYEDCSIITGVGKNWTYKWVRVYTD